MPLIEFIEIIITLIPIFSQFWPKVHKYVPKFSSSLLKNPGGKTLFYYDLEP